MKQYVIGVDFGTDSVRSVLVDTADGTEISSAVHFYQRWKAGKYNDPAKNQFRHHPLDYLEGLENTIRETLRQAPDVQPNQVKGIGVDSTGSTPVAVNETGTPLALLPGMADNPNGMFILWKDHTAIAEAAEINHKARTWGGVDYTRYVGGIYSSEWFWAKMLHVLRTDEAVATNAYSWMELCDWIPFVLVGSPDLRTFRRSRCAAGHKAMWHASWNGLPGEEFLTALDSQLTGIRDRLYQDTYTSDQPAGTLCPEWAAKLGLSENVVVAVGTFDAHAGALGGEIEAYTLVKVMGTSTCDILVAPTHETGDTLVRGICGQVDGSVIPNMLGMEAGQSAFGDVLAWFRDVINWPVKQLVGTSTLLDESLREKLIEETERRTITELSRVAEQIPVDESGIIALDWVNGRRTPDADQSLKGAITGLSMSSDAPRIFRSLVEAICFGSKKIVDRFQREGIPIRHVVGLGGVAKRSPFVMQTLADVLNMPIRVARAEQAPALGAAMLAATAAGLYPDVLSAVRALSNGFDAEYVPNPANAGKYQSLYRQYSALGDFVEQTIHVLNPADLNN